MDEADDQPVSPVVDDRRREGEPAAHVAEGVVSEDGNVTQALLDIADRPGELCADPLNICLQLGDLAGLVRENRNYILFAAGPQEAMARLNSGQAHVGSHGDLEGQNRNTQRVDDQRRSGARAQVHDSSV
jgi:hypothetical protein